MRRFDSLNCVSLRYTDQAMRYARTAKETIYLRGEAAAGIVNLNFKGDLMPKTKELIERIVEPVPLAFGIGGSSSEDGEAHAHINRVLLTERDDKGWTSHDRFYEWPWEDEPQRVTPVSEFIDRVSSKRFDFVRDRIRKEAMLEELFVDEPDPMGRIDLVQWVMSAPDREWSGATKLGTALHKILEELSTGITPQIPDQLRPAVDAWHRWLENHPRLQLVGREVGVWSPYSDMRYSGTIDALWQNRDDGSLVVCDYKTSTSLSETNGYQVAAYSHALSRMLEYSSLNHQGEHSNAPVIPMVLLFENSGSGGDKVFSGHIREWTVDLGENLKRFRALHTLGSTPSRKNHTKRI